SIRVHTITGAPGIGKTTIAYKVAEIISRSIEGGIYGFSFESIPSEAEFLRQLYTTLQIDAGGPDNIFTIPKCFPAITRSLRRHSRTVFFIDNFETLFTKEGQGVRAILQRLIREVPSLTYLVTSRKALEWQIS